MKTALASADKLGQYPDAGMRPGLLSLKKKKKIYQVRLMHQSAFREERTTNNFVCEQADKS